MTSVKNVPETVASGTLKRAQGSTWNQSPGDHAAQSFLEPPRFRAGVRVELVNCPGIPGTVTGVERNKILVRFDDFASDPPKSIRPESLRVVPVATRMIGKGEQSPWAN